ncbi:DUF1365 domain-containing protein [Microseira wollei]|uniref:DUF1365 domain-containing protein n=1 Tax=Microseira wollei NIES-4236 TaxID=2530354 RepID=A0AAV3XL29_9CYAN|nr:DUF1365 domain-containing protein [Microseira wollei]GET40855.1 hypothetical protein MiSe_56670 [Microseira wollei NIES-4236]
MTSRIYVGHLMHTRLEPVKHSFVYPVYFFEFDLSELSKLNKNLIMFGYNQVRPIAIHDKDYLGNGEESIQVKLISFLNKKGCSDDIYSIKLVTVARYFNYVFNPISFFYCYRQDGSLRCTVAEINNTYGEKHLYILDCPEQPRPGFQARYRVSKEFYVSPFNDLKGDYEFHFSEIDELIDIRINILRDEREVFVSRIWGKAIPLNSENLIRTLVRYPMSAALAMPRITWQALVLRYWKGLNPVLKPKPSSEMTIRTAPPSAIQRIERSITSFKYKIYRQFSRGKK